MNIVLKEIDVIAFFTKSGEINPIRFRYKEDGSEENKVIPIDKIVKKKQDLYNGNIMYVFECQSFINDINKQYEIKYGITSPTAKKWLSILVTSGIVHLLQPYHNNALKRMVKAPNMYFMDTGLCAYLTRWTTPEALEVSAMSGAFFETYVVSEIIKSYYYAGKEPPLYYYRDCDKKEIDLIIFQNGTLYPIEIKKSGIPKKAAIKNFHVLNNTKLKIGHGNVICLADDIYPIDKNNFIVPVWLI